jgi:hypothetical protein
VIYRIAFQEYGGIIKFIKLGVIVAMQDFSGVWHSKYRVPSGPEGKIIETEHDVVMYRQGNHLIIETLPKEDGSYMMARFAIDGRIVTGTYHSENSPKSSAKGAVYHGAAQLILNEEGSTLKGKGVGFGKNMEVKISDWELARIHTGNPHASAVKKNA